jgi:NAD(P)-dependent dehydrogenase (short-subunit alcohol dehydrogenase family)
MKGTTALVTGGSRGIGRAVVERLLNDGYEVLNFSRTAPKQLLPGEIFESVDLGDAKRTREAIGDWAAKKQILSLVNNAAMIHVAKIQDVTTEQIEEMVALNMVAPLLLMQGVLPAMRANKYGRIVNLSSRAMLGKDGRTVYGGTKAGLVGMTRTWALETATQGITVNVVYNKGRADFIKAVPEGKGPDLMVGAHDWTGQLVSSGTVAPIVVGSLGTKFSKEMKSGFTIGGKLYGMPIYTENIALVYNKSKAKDPKGMTWEQLLASTRGVTLPFTRGGTGNDPYHMSPIATSFGISMFTRNSSGWTTTVGYTGSAADKYAAWLATNGPKFVDGGWDQMVCNIQNGGYGITGPWIMGSLKSKSSTKLSCEALFSSVFLFIILNCHKKLNNR